MKRFLTILLCAISLPAFAAQGIPTTCSASTSGTTVTLTDTITTAPTWAPAGYRSHFEWLGPLRLHVKYGNEWDNTKSVVTVDTTKLPAGTYIAVGKLALMLKDQVLGWGKCTTSVTVK